MRACVFGLFLTAAVLLPKTGNAQAFSFRTPPPEVTAAATDWQVNSDPIVVSGLVYYPTRAFRMFDGQVMAQVGTFGRVPVYADTTLEPYCLIYVPVGGVRMREYERRRDRELAGTTGSRTPSFPVAVATERAAREPQAGTTGATGIVGTTGVRTDTDAVGTSGRIESSVPTVVGTIGAPDRTRPRRTLVESIPRPSANTGVWLEFNGARWYADGPATTFSPDRFEPVGEYRGFPVYRDKRGNKDEIWVSVVKDGPVAPYTKR
jgi:hypothetical protein